MNYRQAELLATETVIPAAVKTIDLNLKDPLSRITLILELINNGNNPTNHPLAAIKTIEVIDGSEVIASMTGYAAQAMSYHNNGQMPHNELNYEDNAYMRCYVPLDFGRYLYDEEFALDPKNFRNLQLRIDHNYALGGCSPDGANMRVLADLFDEKTIAPIGFLLNKEVFSYTPAEGSPEYIELPLDNTIRKLLVMNTSDDEEPDVQFEKIKIDEEDGKRVIVNCLTMDLIRAASANFGQFQEYFSGHLAAASGEEYFLTACKDLQFGLLMDVTSSYLHFTWTGGRGRTFTASAAGYFGGIVSGRCPHGAVPIFFGKQDNADDWWDVTRIGKGRLIVTPRPNTVLNIDTTKTTDIIVQSLQRY